MIGLVTITVTALCGFLWLLARHQEAKKKPPQPESKIATSGLSVGNVVAWALNQSKASLNWINYREIEREIDDKLSSQLSLHLHVFVLPVADASPRHERLALKMESTPSWMADHCSSSAYLVPYEIWP